MTTSENRNLLACMPDGRPAPYLMTLDELAEFLRLDVQYPRDSVKRMRERGLHAVQVSRSVRFMLDDVLLFLRSEQERNPR